MARLKPKATTNFNLFKPSRGSLECLMLTYHSRFIYRISIRKPRTEIFGSFKQTKKGLIFSFLVTLHNPALANMTIIIQLTLTYIIVLSIVFIILETILLVVENGNSQN